MIEYVVPENIDHRSLRKAVAILEGGGLVALPTDTTWSVCAGIGSRGGVELLKRLSGRDRRGPLTVICADLGQAATLCEVSTAAYREMRRLVPGPYVFVLPSTRRAARDFDLHRGELGLRIPDNPVPLGLVGALGSPLLSVTAKRSMLGMDPAETEFPEELLFAAGWELEDLPGLDLVLDPGTEQDRRVSTVLDLREGGVAVLRAGVGAYP